VRGVCACTCEYFGVCELQLLFENWEQFESIFIIRAKFYIKFLSNLMLSNVHINSIHSRSPSSLYCIILF
jgi:hypothetical protein